MIAPERHRRIIDYLQQNGTARVSALADLLSVTTETIRRDLEKLESVGQVVRAHGGAMVPDPRREESPFAERQEYLHQEKAAIAAEAVSRLHPGDTIMIDSSTTLLEFARGIPDMQLTVITNSCHAIMALAGRPKVTVVCLGGILHTASMSFTGPAAEEQLRSYYVDKCFMSCRGLDLVGGVFDSSEVHATLKEIMLSRSREKYLLVDHTKFDSRSLARFSSVSDFSEIISDAGLSHLTHTRYSSAGAVTRSPLE